MDMAIMPVAYGIEAHCFEDFRLWVIQQYNTPKLVALRDPAGIRRRDDEVRRYNDYFKQDLEILCACPYVHKLQEYPFINSHTYLSSPTIKLHARCEKAIRDDIPKLATIFCEVTYGSIEKALKATTHLYELWNAFEEWFERWRKRVMGELEGAMVNAINRSAVSKDAVAKMEVGKKLKPGSVGGVANLLKVLTKTMEQQGADIKSIAKMQWFVCRQQGIILPDEFLRDVAVALEIEEKLG